ncbi:uncharacterized protein LOC142617200 [Castanea sativa]|uniref:uncharacterized protein LOC142617200 n=1 Tax=Castanea sativa TaxID=21020 RepID=UPI003F64F574
MPKIDQLVDATYGHQRMSFLDAFQGYHQIALVTEDQEKTTFISPEANYHYTVMSFGLKSAGATYQRMMKRTFRDKIGCTVEVYIDDMVVKSKQEKGHIDDLKEVFEVLQRYKLRLNADKCAFGVRVDKFLGYMITCRGIEINPDQIQAVERLELPSNPKEVQVLTDMLAALNQFISKFTDRHHPFYQLLKKWRGFQWNKKCERAFRDLKEYLVRAPMLSTLEPGPYRLCINQEYPLQSLLKRSNFTGRIAKWGTRLGFFDIRYRLRSSVKRQVLVDFVVEFSLRGEIEIVCHVEVPPWKVFVDGVSSALGAEAGAGIIIITPEGIKLEYPFRLDFRASNNEAEYEALLARLKAALGLGARDVEACSDSWLVVNQVQGSFEAKDTLLTEYLQLVKQTISQFQKLKVVQITKGLNHHADSLATLASSLTEEVPRLIKVEVMTKPSIDEKTSVSMVTRPEPCWMTPIIDFLAEDQLPADRKEEYKVRRMVA